MNTKSSSLLQDLRVTPATIRMGALIAGLVAAGLFVFIFLNRSNVSGKEYYRPAGYIERVNDLIQTGRLVYLPPVSKADATPWGQIQFVEEPANLPSGKVDTQNLFVEESRRLRNDIDRFNESGEGVFSIRRRRNSSSGKMEAQIRFDESSYNFFLPYPERKPMDSKFSFGGEELPTLGGDGIALGFSALDEKVSTPDPDDIISLPMRKWFQPSPSNGGYYQALGYNLLGAESGAVINLRATEKGTTLRVFAPQRFSLYINGISLQKPGGEKDIEFAKERRKDLPVNTFRLAEGDRIRIRDQQAKSQDPEMVFRFGRFDGASIMQSWVENGQLVSQVDPKVAQSLPFTQQIVSATNAYGSGKGLRPPKIQHTVNQTLNSILQTKLDSFIRHFDASLARVPHTEYEPACIAVVDAMTGDVLAVPSYPSPTDLQKLELQFQTGRAPNHVSESKVSRLKWNQNFPTIPIGSTTKPILATAIWDADPKLQKLVINEPAGSAGSIYGLRLARPLTTVSNARTVDPVNFLGKSSNTYTVSLFLLTLANPDSYTINRNGFVSSPNGKVDFSRHVKGDLIPNGLLSDDLPANQKLAECFDIDLNTDYVFGTSALIDRQFIEPLLEQLKIEKTDPLPAVFWPVTPARTVLNLQEVDVVRGELVSMLLGGNTNRWSNLKLAEAYARIGSGKKVKARLLKDSKSRDQPSFESMPNQKVLDLVHQGMTASWNSGTAMRIKDEVQREANSLRSGLKLKFIGKTGTARRTKYECAAFAFYAEIQDAKGNPLSAISTTLYLQDRADSRGGARNSAIAVELASKILPDLVDWMKKTKPVQNYQK